MNTQANTSETLSTSVTKANPAAGPPPSPQPAGGWRFRGVDFAIDAPDGAILRGEHHGDGPTIVLSHCWTGDRQTWGPVARRLKSDGFHVVVYDQRGHGTSSLGSTPATMKRLAADLMLILERLNITDALIAGHSLGGMAAIQAALDEASGTGDFTEGAQAKRVTGLVLVSTSAQPLPARLRKLRVGKALASVIGSKFADRLIASKFGSKLARPSLGKKPSDIALHQTLQSLRSTRPHVRGSQLSQIGEFDVLSETKDIRIPTNIIVGSRDRVTPPRHARSLAKNISGSTLTHLKGAGHMLPLERPDAVSQAIRDLRTQTIQGKLNV